MPYFNVECKKCKNVFGTPHVADFEAEKTNPRKEPESLKLKCPTCGHTDTYVRGADTK